MIEPNIFPSLIVSVGILLMYFEALTRVKIEGGATWYASPPMVTVVGYSSRVCATCSSIGYATFSIDKNPLPPLRIVISTSTL